MILTALWHRKVAKTCKATILLAWFKQFPRADCEGMWQVPIFAIISTYATCQSEHYQDIDNIMCTM